MADSQPRRLSLPANITALLSRLGRSCQLSSTLIKNGLVEKPSKLSTGPERRGLEVSGGGGSTPGPLREPGGGSAQCGELPLNYI